MVVQYDKTNNYAYVGFRYRNTSSVYKTGVMKLDLSQIGVSTSSTFVGFASVVNSSNYAYLSTLESDGYIMLGLLDGTSGVVNTATMTLESISPSYATSSVRGRHYSSITSALYFTNGNNYLEGQKFNASAGEMPVASDFQVLTKSGYNNSNQAIMGSLGSHTHSDEDYSESTAAQRAAIDIDKGNSTTGHVNRVTTTA